MTEAPRTAAVLQPGMILVADVDGTLRGPGEDLGEGVAAMLRRIVECGGMFVPASGKSVEHLAALFSRHKVECRVICGENGADIIHRLDGSSWKDITVSHPDERARIRTHVIACTACNSWEYEEPKESIVTVHFGTAARAREKATIWRQHLTQILGHGEVAVYVHDDGAVDAVPHPSRVSKATVIALLRGRFPGVPIVVAGDGENDLPMMQARGVFTVVCPENAHPKVVEAAVLRDGRRFDGRYGVGVVAGIRWACAQYHLMV